MPRPLLFWYVVLSLGGLFLSFQALPSVFGSLTFTETFLGSLGVFLSLKELVIGCSLSRAAESRLVDQPFFLCAVGRVVAFPLPVPGQYIFPDLIMAPLFLQLDYSLLVTLKREIDVWHHLLL